MQHFKNAAENVLEEETKFESNRELINVYRMLRIVI